MKKNKLRKDSGEKEKMKKMMKIKKMSRERRRREGEGNLERYRVKMTVLLRNKKSMSQSCLLFKI